MWNKIICVILLSFMKANAQNDLYNLENSLKYARYLNISKQVNLAKNEYQRAFYLSNNADSIATEMFDFYITNNDFESAINTYKSTYQNTINAPYRVTKIYFSSLLLNTNNLFNNNLSKEDNNDLIITHSLLNSNFKGAKMLIHQSENPTLLIKDYEVNIKEFEYKNKKLALAALYSTAIPGLGKIYSSYWKDGLMSLLFVSTSAYQSYRGFDKTGIKSGIGWAFGAVAFGFYTGNIYGSYKAAQKYNNKQKANSRKKIENIFKRHI